MKRATWIMSILALVCLSNTYAGIEDFDCRAATYLVDLFQKGVDEIYEEVEADPEYFVRETLDDWECFPDPPDMSRAGRKYIESLVCVYTNNKKRVSNNDFKRAGSIFKDNIKEFSNCFRRDVLSEAPMTYSNETQGEGMIMLLDRVIHNSHHRTGRSIKDAKVLIEYGYVQAKPRTPLMWKIEVGASIPDTDADSESARSNDKKSTRSRKNSCEYARDGDCDEPDLCGRGTDTDDCAGRNRTSSTLNCCDALGQARCPIVVNPGPMGSPCWCNGLSGYGIICRQ